MRIDRKKIEAKGERRKAMFCFINTPAYRLEDKRKSNFVQTNDEYVMIIERNQRK